METKKLFKSDYFEKLIIQLNAPGLDKKTNFFRLMSVTQKAGLGVRDALTSIRNSEKHRGFIIIIQDLINQLTQGIGLAKAMENHDYFFNIDEIALVSAAEKMGNMPETLTELAQELENLQEINGKIKKALTYPTILISMSIVAVVVLLVFVMPTIVAMFPNQESLPGITKFMLGISGVLKHTRYIFLAGIGGLVIGYKLAYQFFLPFKIFIDKLAIVTPIVGGVVKTFYMYRFSKLLGQFYGSGVSPVVSLELMSEIFVNFLYKKKVIEIKTDLETGFNFYESMEGSDLFDAILVQIIHVGEDTGDTATVLTTISDFYRNELKSKIDILMAAIEPILMIFIAGIIGSIVGAIFIPMADIVNQIK